MIMEFSKKYLHKYGWQEGQGLGSLKDGIKVAIKPKLKFDKAGLGFDPSLEFTDHWWEKVYNTASAGTDIGNHEENEPTHDADRKNKNQTVTTKNKKLKENHWDSDNLYKACNGRTVHKGARHGLQMSAKLQRLEEQERSDSLQQSGNEGSTIVNKVELDVKISVRRCKTMKVVETDENPLKNYTWYQDEVLCSEICSENEVVKKRRKKEKDILKDGKKKKKKSRTQTLEPV